MATDQEERIRQRAYEIWEREGRPHGQDDAHWAMAVQEIQAEDGGVDDAADPAEPAGEVPVMAGSASGEQEPVAPVAAATSEKPEEPEAAPKKAKRAAKPKAAKPETAASGRKRKAVDAGERVER